MRRTVATLALLALVACGKEAAKPPPAKAVTLTLSDDAGRAIATLTPDDAIMDGAGTVVGRVDWHEPAVIIGGTQEALAYDLEARGISVVTSLGTFHAVVDDATELRVDDKPLGKLSG